MGEMHINAFEVIRPEGAALASFVPAGIEHEMLNDELMSSRKETFERHRTTGAVEDIRFVDLRPRQRAPLRAELITESCEFFLAL